MLLATLSSVAMVMTSQLMTDILRENYQNETFSSYLAPFSYGFYSKFGYSYVFNQKHYEINAVDFPVGAKTDLTVKRLAYATARVDLACVHAQAVGNGSLVRGDFEWSIIMTIKSSLILRSSMIRPTSWLCHL